VKRAVFLLVLASCAEPADPAADLKIIGGPGAVPGRFATPRAMAQDAAGRLFVVDKTGRIQRFSAAGVYEAGWATPEVAKGRPTGIAVEPSGDVLVADTHYHRILRYSADGALKGRFGSLGLGPGQFTYPTGLAVAADGTIYVSEFGGNEDGKDRIQVFTPDGNFVREWGKYGEGPGEFHRPQGIALAGGRLYVTDVANHRIQVFEAADGRFVREWGGVKYPYGISVDGDGNVLVAEYGSHRISKFAPDGRLIAAAGGAGTGPGELNTPWGVLAAGPRIYVVDTNNHRLQDWPAGRLGAHP
jgi:DNA-binding beta-propeller fold protein YncE